MSTSRNINIAGGLSNAFQSALNLSVSPVSTFPSPSSSFPRAQAANASSSKQLKPFNTGDVKILLLENVNQTAQDSLRQQGYQVEFIKSALPEDELIEKIRYAAPPLQRKNATLPHQNSTILATQRRHAQRSQLSTSK